MQCPKCGYILSAFDDECPRCKKLGKAPEDKNNQELSRQLKSQKSGSDAKANLTTPYVNGNSNDGFCPSCGGKLAPHLKYCPKCGRTSSNLYATTKQSNNRHLFVIILICGIAIVGIGTAGLFLEKAESPHAISNNPSQFPIKKQIPVAEHKVPSAPTTTTATKPNTVNYFTESDIKYMDHFNTVFNMVEDASKVMWEKPDSANITVLSSTISSAWDLMIRYPFVPDKFVAANNYFMDALVEMKQQLFDMKMYRQFGTNKEDVLSDSKTVEKLIHAAASEFRKIQDTYKEK